MTRQRYRKRPTEFVIAVQLDLDIDGFTYRKWGSTQNAKRRDWGEVRTKEGSTHYDAGDYLVSNEPDGGDAYAVSRQAFERMYEPA